MIEVKKNLIKDFQVMARNNLKVLAKLVSGLALAAILSVFLVEKVQAYICNPSFPSSVDVGTQADISFDLSQESSAVSCLDNPNRQRCYVIKGCNTGMSGAYGCEDSLGANLYAHSFDIPNQRISGNQLVAGETRDSGLTFWLEQWNPAGGVLGSGEGSRACSGQEWRINMAGAYCDAAAFRVVGIRNGQEVSDYTPNDPLVVKFDGSYTHNFIQGLYSILIVKSPDESPVKDLGEFPSPVGGGNRLHSAFQGLTSDISIGTLPAGEGGIQNYQIVVTDTNFVGREKYCHFNFAVSADGQSNQVDENAVFNYELCSQIPITDPGRPLCESCLAAGSIWTGIGCIKATPIDIVGTVVRVGLGLAGGISLLMILAAAGLYTTSQGNPKRTEEARELVTSAIIGLLFIIFSVVILQFIGVSILRLPEFGV